MNQTELADKIRAAREEFGWTQTDFARHMVSAGWPMYTQMTVSRTESYKRGVGYLEAMTMQKIFGIDFSDPSSVPPPLAAGIDAAIERLQDYRDSLS